MNVLNPDNSSFLYVVRNNLFQISNSISMQNTRKDPDTLLRTVRGSPCRALGPFQYVQLVQILFFGRTPWTATDLSDVNWPYAGYHNVLEHNLEWSFFEVIGFFYPNYFQIFREMETFFQNAFVFKLYPLNICFLPISSFCFSVFFQNVNEIVNFRILSSGHGSANQSGWTFPTWHFELECELRKFPK